MLSCNNMLPWMDHRLSLRERAEAACQWILTPGDYTRYSGIEARVRAAAIVLFLDNDCGTEAAWVLREAIRQLRDKGTLE